MDEAAIERVYRRQIEQYPVLSHEEEAEIGRKLNPINDEFDALIRSAGYAVPGTRWLVIKNFSAGLEHAVASGKPYLGREGNELKSLYDEVVRLKTAARLLKDSLITANLRIVVAFAKKYRGLSLLDRIQDGNAGITRAAEDFDYTFDVKFVSYAGHWVRAYILRGVIEKRHTIVIPLNRQRQLQAIEKFFAKNPEINYDNFGMHMGQICAATGLLEEQVFVAIDSSKVKTLLSLDTPPNPGTESTLAETVPDLRHMPEAECGDIEAAGIIFDAIRQLNRAESKLVLISRIYYGMTLEEIGNEWGYTREAIRLIEKKAARECREIIETMGIRARDFDRVFSGAEPLAYVSPLPFKGLYEAARRKCVPNPRQKRAVKQEAGHSGK